MGKDEPDKKSSHDVRVSSAGDSASRELDDEPAQLDSIGQPVPSGFFSEPPGQESLDGQPTVDGQPTSIGDYDIIESLGEGGMGVVYLARQRSADRMVALKVIRPERLSNLRFDQRQQVVERFQTEARAAAQLEHDNIVTIHDVGEWHGQQYFSMRYVPGRSLAELLRDGPLDNRRAATYLQPVCEALQVAHSRGVLHRDLKPQNILVDDETDRALVADFGLAKLTEQDDSLTRDGDVMGTPQYMSPEQAINSASVTPQSDVYALGATLYHLLTGRPVFQAATSWETLRQVIDRTPVSPRQLNPAVHLDLDTICLKCLEKDPARRYQSAGELADELQRYLNGEPIHARPLGRLGRFSRWCRRNPVVAATSGFAITCLVGALIAVSYFLVQTQDAQQRSETSFLHALDTVNTFFTRVSEETLLEQPGLQPLRQDLLRQALAFYEGFLSQRSGDPSIQDRLAETHYRVGLITAEIESPEKAIPSYDRAIGMQRKLSGLAPDELRHVYSLANSLNAKAKALFNIDQTDEALEVFHDSRKLRERLAKSVPGNEEYQRRLANTHMNIAIVLKRNEDLAGAQRELTIAQEIRQKLLNSDPQDKAKVLRDLAKGHYTLGDLLDRSDALEAALKSFDAAVSDFTNLIEIEDTINDQYFLSGAFFGRAGLLTDKLAIEDYRRALEVIRPLAAQNPKVEKIQSMLLSCQFELAFCESRLGLFGPATASLSGARETAEKLAEKNSDYLQDLTKLLLELAKVESRDEPQHALLERYDRYLAEAAEKFPQAEIIRALRAEIRQKLAENEN